MTWSSVSPAANRIWDGRNFVNGSYVSAEEVIANFTVCEARLRSYEGVEDRLADLRGYVRRTTGVRSPTRVSRGTCWAG